MRLQPSWRTSLLGGALTGLAASIVAWMLLRGAGNDRPVAEPAPSAAEASAAPFREEEVHFSSGGNTLAGVLVLPATPGPHPAVAFVHGSGSLGRNDGTLHPPLREHLARCGIASLCWDKPGVGDSGGDWTRQSFHDRAREALDAVRFLRGRADIDRGHVGLWGISQGGWVCPLAAALSPDVAFLILVSAPAGTIAEQDLFRVEQGMRADGRPQGDIDRALAFARRRIELIRTGTFEELNAAQREAAGQRWFTDYVHRLGPKDFAFGAKNIAYDGRPALEGVQCPVLVVVGERDTVVPAKEAAATIKEILAKAGNTDVTVKTFPGADHFLRATRAGGPSEALAGGPPQTLAPGYPSTLTEWLGERRATPAASPAALAERARQQIQDGDWPGAARSYAILLRLNPYRPDHWHNYAYVQHQRGRYEEAVRAWEKAAELGLAWDPLWERGLVWDKAWVTGFGPGTPVPWYNVARAQARLGRTDDALRALRRALDEGFADEESLRTEPDLAPLRGDARFRSLTGRFPPDGLSRDDRWRYDLDYLARRLDQMHCRFGGKAPRADLGAAVRALRERVPALADHQVVVEIQRVMALAGDGHTRLWWPEQGAYAVPRYPVEFYLYSDGLVVRRAAGDLAGTVGGRVVSIAGRSAGQALRAVEPLCSADGPMGVKAEAPRLLARPDVLQTLGMTRDMDHVPLVVERGDGTRVTAELARPRPGHDAPAGWLAINARARAALPLYLRGREEPYWFEYVPEARLVYLQYNAVADRKDESLAQFCRRMMAFIDDHRAENLAIDLRHNGGGNGLLNRALLRELVRSDTINRKGHLFVILGRNTSSAAMSLATDLERQAECLFVGEPSCSGPNFRGQANPVTLPCSGLRLSCASLYYQGALLSSDRRPWVAPDIVAELSSADEADNRDPALAAVVDEIRSR
jgi:alpha-beta hydrolase superfamily lysophospholipase